MKLENTNKNDRFSKEHLLLKGKHSYIGKVSTAPGLKIGFSQFMMILETQ